MAICLSLSKEELAAVTLFLWSYWFCFGNILKLGVGHGALSFSYQTQNSYFFGLIKFVFDLSPLVSGLTSNLKSHL